MGWGSLACLLVICNITQIQSQLYVLISGLRYPDPLQTGRGDAAMSMSLVPATSAPLAGWSQSQAPGTSKQCQPLQSRRLSRMIRESGLFIVSAFSPLGQRFARFVHRRRESIRCSKDGATPSVATNTKYLFIGHVYRCYEEGNATTGSLRHSSRLHRHACRTSAW